MTSNDSMKEQSLAEVREVPEEAEEDCVEVGAVSSTQGGLLGVYPDSGGGFKAFVT